MVNQAVKDPLSLKRTDETAPLLRCSESAWCHYGTVSFVLEASQTVTVGTKCGTVLRPNAMVSYIPRFNISSFYYDVDVPFNAELFFYLMCLNNPPPQKKPQPFSAQMKEVNSQNPLNIC